MTSGGRPPRPAGCCCGRCSAMRLPKALEAYEFLGVGDGQQAAWSTSEQRLQTLVFYPLLDRRRGSCRDRCGRRADPTRGALTACAAPAQRSQSLNRSAT